MEKVVESTSGITVSHISKVHSGIPTRTIFFLNIQLHGFVDASVVACCVAKYLLISQSSGTYSKLLTSKSRIAKSGLSVPRLELVGALILTNVVNNAKSALGHDISETYGWLDSQTVLFWLQNKREWKQFVRKQVDKILESDLKWNYCSTDDNPADNPANIGTREITAVKLSKTGNGGKVRNGYQRKNTGHNNH